MESYVKDFKPLQLGTIDLPQGKGTLTLRALDNPGGQVMEFRLLMLTRAVVAGTFRLAARSIATTGYGGTS